MNQQISFSGRRFLPVGAAVAMLIGASGFAGAATSAAAPGSAASASKPPAPTLTALAAPGKRAILPTPQEWMSRTGVQPKVVEKRSEELDLIEYREPDISVLDTSVPPTCPEPRREGTWEVVFGKQGRVEALRQVDTSVCPPMADAWKDSIATWQMRPISRFGEDNIPALIRVTVKFGGRPAPVREKN